ncbi:MAG TPA: penicillin-binding protein 2 [Stellaceae bacterium]|nr:penicillin-binding protein 2 [Stellaceae bacterium]
MVALSRFDDNPCQPRHFKPPPCAPVIRDAQAQEALETGRTRLLVAGALFVLLFAVVALRLVDVMVLSGGADTALNRQRGMPPPLRASILDRGGRLLATSLASPSLYANPKEIADPAAAARELAAVLPRLSPADLYTKLTANKRFVWIERHLTPRQEYDVNRLGIPGLQFQREERRVYPYGDLLAHVVGFTGIDNKGFAGVERGLDGVLDGRSEPVQLSIDVRLQYILHHELQRVVEDFTAKSAAGLIMNVNTGEILAMVSLPDFDPNRPDAPDAADPGVPLKERLFNRATLGDYEIGSVFKIFTVAMALDSGVATMTSRFDATNPIKIGRFTISDYHGKRRPLSVPEIIAYSSNIGAAKIGVAAGPTRLRDYLGRFGLLQPPTLELSEVGRPHFPKVWHEVNVLTIAFGHGISETLLNIADGACAIVNGGILRQPTLLKLPRGYAPEGRRVISQETSLRMRKLLRLVVESGTAKMAAAPGYVVGGKTGTAERVEHGAYARHSLRSSFIGVFPMNDPKYLILTMVDEPHGTKASYGYATAGWTAAPATKRIVERIAPLLGVGPVDENSPAIADKLQISSLIGHPIAPY